MVKDKRLKRFMERLYCDVCYDELVFKNEKFSSNLNIIYTYTCNDCNIEEDSCIKYPRIIEKEID